MHNALRGLCSQRAFGVMDFQQVCTCQPTLLRRACFLWVHCFSHFLCFLLKWKKQLLALGWGWGWGQPFAHGSVCSYPAKRQMVVVILLGLTSQANG